MSMISNRLSRFVISSCFTMLLLMASVSALAGPIDINTADADTWHQHSLGLGSQRQSHCGLS